VLNISSTNTIIKKPNLEDVMKKILSLLAMAMMIVSLSGCMDDPDGGNPKPKGYGTPSQQGGGIN
jgi:hypothetical protein